MPRAVFVIVSYHFQNSFDSEPTRKKSKFNKGDDKMAKLVRSDTLYFFAFDRCIVVHGSKAGWQGW